MAKQLLRERTVGVPDGSRSARPPLQTAELAPAAGCAAPEFGRHFLITDEK